MSTEGCRSCREIGTLLHSSPLLPSDAKIMFGIVRPCSAAWNLLFPIRDAIFDADLQSVVANLPRHEHSEFKSSELWPPFCLGSRCLQGIIPQDLQVFLRIRAVLNRANLYSIQWTVRRQSFAMPLNKEMMCFRQTSFASEGALKLRVFPSADHLRRNWQE